MSDDVENKVIKGRKLKKHTKKPHKNTYLFFNLFAQQGRINVVAIHAHALGVLYLSARPPVLSIRLLIFLGQLTLTCVCTFRNSSRFSFDEMTILKQVVGLIMNHFEDQADILYANWATNDNQKLYC